MPDHRGGSLEQKGIPIIWHLMLLSLKGHWSHAWPALPISFAVMSCLAALNDGMPQRDRSEVIGNRSKPEHEWLNPAVAPH